MRVMVSITMIADMKIELPDKLPILFKDSCCFLLLVTTPRSFILTDDQSLYKAKTHENFNLKPCYSSRRYSISFATLSSSETNTLICWFLSIFVTSRLVMALSPLSSGFESDYHSSQNICKPDLLVFLVQQGP